MDTHQQKNELRQLLIDQRKAIAEADFERASERIRQTLKQQPEFRAVHFIHCYVSMNERREVNTHSLIKEMIRTGKQVAVPVTNFQEGVLSHHQLRSFEELESNKWGVLEPNGGKKIAPEELDLVIVPMVGGDEQGNRIGYGEGFYDRFLEEVTCPKIGLCFEQNIVGKIPTEDFDIPMDKIISEERVIRRV